MAIDFSKTQTDIRALVQNETQRERGRRLANDFNAMAAEIKAQKQEITDLRLVNAATLTEEKAKAIAQPSHLKNENWRILKVGWYGIVPYHL